VSAETYEIENRRGPAQSSRASEPYHNPSYPERDHFSERSRLDEALRTSETRIDAARRKLESGGDFSGKAQAVRYYHQLLGVRDQIAECCRRIPLEAGELYEEDKERFEHAISALERVWDRWEKTIA
jgi:hypothetical protein